MGRRGLGIIIGRENNPPSPYFNNWVGLASDDHEHNKRQKFKKVVMNNEYFGVTSSVFTQYLYDKTPSYEEAKNHLIKMIKNKNN